MYPALAGSGYLFKYPSDFDIEFYTIDSSGTPKINKYLTFFATSVLTSLDVDYSGGGEYSSFKETNAPVEVDITLGFRETVIITKNFLQSISGEVVDDDKNDSALNMTLGDHLKFIK